MWLLCAQSILSAVGEAHALLAMTLVGFVTSIPVFADAAFIVLSPVVTDIIRRGGHRTAHFALALGLATSHTMVPPTPGPVFAAAAIGADLGLVVAAGSLVAVTGCIVATLFCFVVPPPRPRQQPAGSEPRGGARAEGGSTQRGERPTLWRSLLPILLPMLLIGIGSASSALQPAASDAQGGGLLRFLGHPEIALCIGVASACAVLPLPEGRKELSVDGAVGQGVNAAAPIVLITAAGGGFGGVIGATGVGATVAAAWGGEAGSEGGGMPAAGFSILVPMAIAAALKCAQGSGTVAITLTASLVAGMLPAEVEGFQRALVVVAIGAGSLAVIHVNDSFFCEPNPTALSFCVSALTCQWLRRGDLAVHRRPRAADALAAHAGLADALGGLLRRHRLALLGAGGVGRRRAAGGGWGGAGGCAPLRQAARARWGDGRPPSWRGGAGAAVT